MLAFGELASQFHFERRHRSSVGLTIQSLVYTELMGEVYLIYAQLWYI